MVSLVSGGVSLRSEAGPSGAPFVLKAGQQARLSPAGISAPHPFDEIAVGAWRRGQIVFYETPLADVVAELNRNRPGRIVILDETLKRLRISGVFKTDAPDEVIAAIQETLPVRVQRLTDLLVLLR